MKRTFWAVVAMVLVLILLCGCTDGLTGLQIDQITKIEIIDLIADNHVELDQGDEDFTAIVELLKDCQQSLIYKNDCQPEDGHQHQLAAYTGNTIAVSLIVNADGSFCIGKSHYELNISGTKLGAYLYLLRRAAMVYNTYLEMAESFTSPLVLAQAGDWTYFCQQIVLNSMRYTILARENDLGDGQLVYEIREPYGDHIVNTIEYVEDSLTASDDSMLYFSIYNEDSGSSRLLGFSVLTDTIVLLPEDPCSNLLIIENGKDSYSGWLVCGDAILSVDLASGEIMGDRTRTIKDLGGLPEIEGALFRDPKSVTAIRYVALAQGSGAGTIVIQIWQRENNGAPEMIQEYIYDLTSLELAG